MSHQYAQTMFTRSVKAQQELAGSLEHNEKLRASFGPNDVLGVKEIEFVARRDSFFLATVSETDWPYVQHRGGPPGFLSVLEPKKLAFADFRGNAQLISTGNLSANDRCSLILMDYAKRRRLKLIGHIRVQHVNDVAADILSQLISPEYNAVIERVYFIELIAFDWNCPQHITRRYTEDEYLEAVATRV